MIKDLLFCIGFGVGAVAIGITVVVVVCSFVPIVCYLLGVDI